MRVLILYLFSLTYCDAIKLGFIVMESAPEPFDIRRLGPAVDIALEASVTEYNVTFELERRTYPGVCPYEPPPGLFSELYHKHDIRALLGPACSQGVLSVGRLAAYFGVPMVTGLGDLIVRRPEDPYKSLTILSYDLQKLSCKYCLIVLRFKLRLRW